MAKRPLRRPKKESTRRAPVREAGYPPTIDSLLHFLAPKYWTRRSRPPPTWPPDVFGIVTSVLYHSGAYLEALQGEPLIGTSPKEIGVLGDEWRTAWINKRRPPPAVAKWWSTVVDAASTPLHEVCNQPPLRTALLSLCIAADQACRQLGTTESMIEGNPQHAFFFDGFKSLFDQDYTTLCRAVHPSVCRVLPKTRTCQSGLTVRSLSHWLAYFPPGEVTTRWVPGMAFSPSIKDAERHLNLLLVPWPLEVLPSHFSPAQKPARPKAGPFDFFSYYAPSNAGVVELVDGLIKRSRQVVGPLAGVILPEVALCPHEYEAVRLHTHDKGVFLIAGVNEVARGEPSRNRVEMSFPFADVTNVNFTQDKHHRWRLDQQQIIRYGLGSRLPIGVDWWEGISIPTREVKFLELRSWLVACVLICEDLARPDPVADIIRSVGPNLVVALLHDGPQFKSRWQARYASVLADDPGSSVLTLTSLGMAQLSRELERQERSRVVALWKDPSSSLIEISLPEGHNGIVLSLAVKKTKEWTADGRCSDNEDASEGSRAVLKLAGIQPISLTT